MKYEWRKKEKKIYIPKETPEIITLPSYTYLSITGKGNPNSEAFQSCVEALYALSYGIKMSPKKGIDIKGYFDYTVFPLEGLWNLDEEGIRKFTQGVSIVKLKNHFTFILSIRQPEFVTEKLFSQIQQSTFAKKKNNRILDVYLNRSREETVCQCLHIGSYDSEPATFTKMNDYLTKEGYQRTFKSHTEVYIGDPRKTETSKLKTTLRVVVSK